MQEKRNLWRTTLECNGGFLFVYRILFQKLGTVPWVPGHGSVPAVTWTLILLSACEGRSWMKAALPALCSGEDNV